MHREHRKIQFTKYKTQCSRAKVVANEFMQLAASSCPRKASRPGSHAKGTSPFKVLLVETEGKKGKIKGRKIEGKTRVTDNKGRSAWVYAQWRRELRRDVKLAARTLFRLILAD